MDIEANLKELRELAKEVMKIDDAACLSGLSDKQIDRLYNIALRQAELFQAMDGWLSSGGFRPQSWIRRS